jgi:hypothetical protein
MKRRSFITLGAKHDEMFPTSETPEASTFGKVMPGTSSDCSSLMDNISRSTMGCLGELRHSDRTDLKPVTQSRIRSISQGPTIIGHNPIDPKGIDRAQSPVS